MPSSQHAEPKQQQQQQGKRTSTRLALKRNAKKKEQQQQLQQVASVALEKQQEPCVPAQHAQHEQHPVRQGRPLEDSWAAEFAHAAQDMEPKHSAPASPMADKKPAVVIDPALVEEPNPQLIPQYCPLLGPGTAIVSGLHHSYPIQPETQPVRTARQRGDLQCGLWSLLPEELVEIILKQCTLHQLGQLESTCSFFRGNKTIERIAKQRLKAVPRAKGLKPSKKDGETHTMLLHYVQCQSAAAAQATSIACGAYHSAVLMLPRQVEGLSVEPHQAPRHSLFTFGRGFHGQLGTESHANSKSPASVTLGFKPCLDQPDAEEETMPAVVACGAHHSTAISRKGELFSWGLGCHGELGLGRWAPLELTLPRQCSAPQVRIVSVACGNSHTLAIAENGTLWSCGKNRHGQLGNGTMQDGTRLQPVLHVGNCRIVSAAAGVSHSMALASDGSLFTWGDGSCGQLGHSQLQQIAAAMPQENPLTMITAQKITRLEPSALAPENRITAIAAGGHHSMALTVGGNILAFGANSQGQLGLGDTTNRWKPTRIKLPMSGEEEGRCLRVVQVACGASFSMALFSNQGTLEVRTTGSNSYGQLGHGDRVGRLTFRPIMKVPDVVAVQAGDEHAAAVTASGDLYMWGRGDSGQLGMGDNRAKWKPSLLKEFVVVHPDKTLRRNKRSQPFIRPMKENGKADKTPSIPLL
uniref:RCC1-like domain-containing protein n=1 Tax=Dunaliella tertiolecta TaxID=3047 RepID=A0A7S3R4J6_DUNTE